MTHNDKRHETTTLFSALSILEDKVTGACMPRHTHQEPLKFLHLSDQQTPADKELLVIADYNGALKHPRVIRWLKRHPRFHTHSTPTGASWLNQFESFLSDRSTQRTRRGAFASVREPVTAFKGYIAQHNREPEPSIWTTQVSDLAEKVKRA
jgi:hypothetical protein